ncbi:conserved hypothetical protein, partial [Trichinella spiralis]|uniref:hypothetical protein n=1 Tax=Trichinella spiralis TaxID=6334 RepID=UPI0001EFE114
MDRVISLKPVSGQHGTRRLRRGKSPLTGRRAGGGAGAVGLKKTLLEIPLLGSEQGGRPLVPQPGEEE